MSNILGRVHEGLTCTWRIDPDPEFGFRLNLQIPPTYIASDVDVRLVSIEYVDRNIDILQHIAMLMGG